MTPEQIKLVRNTFAQVAPMKAQAAAMFYDRLFEVAPQLRPLFKGDIAEQGDKLMTAMAMAVGGLDRLEEIAPQVQDLARRHVGYGAEEGHFAVAGETLLWTLAQGLGDDFTSEVETAWKTAFGILADAMIATMREAKAAG